MIGRIMQTLALTLTITAAHAATISFSTSFLTDASQPASATALFSYSGSGNTMTLTLTDTTSNPISDAPNLADISFVLPSLTSGSVGNASGTTITGNTAGTTGTLGSYNGASPWTFTYQNGGWAAGNSGGATGPNSYFDLYANSNVSAATHNTTSYSIVGAPGAGGIYTGGSGAIGSANTIGSSNDGAQFDQTATFQLTIAGLNSTNFAQLTNVKFGFGPDGVNTPDADDISAGVFGSYCANCGGGPNGSVPEPSSMALIGVGLSGLAVVGRKFRKN